LSHGDFETPKFGGNRLSPSLPASDPATPKPDEVIMNNPASIAMTVRLEFVDFILLPPLGKKSRLVAYFEAEIAQPPLAVLSLHFVKPAWQLRSANSSAAFCDDALSFVPQMM
jgi:hypothetical protein